MRPRSLLKESDRDFFLRSNRTKLSGGESTQYLIKTKVEYGMSCPLGWPRRSLILSDIYLFLGRGGGGLIWKTT